VSGETTTTFYASWSLLSCRARRFDASYCYSMSFLGIKFHHPKIEGDYGLETWSGTLEDVGHKAGIPSLARPFF
jgi:hypothetical protein